MKQEEAEKQADMSPLVKSYVTNSECDERSLYIVESSPRGTAYDL